MKIIMTACLLFASSTCAMAQLITTTTAPASAPAPAPTQAPAAPAKTASPATPAVTPAAPATARPAQVSGTEELDNLRAQNAILAEQVKAYELKSKMGIVVPPIDSGSMAPIPLSRGGGGNLGISRPGPTGPQVTMVAGTRENLVATILTADGGQIAVKVGDTVPGMGKVKKIEANQVLVESGKKSTAIPFAPEPTSAAIQGAMPSPFMGSIK